MATEYQNISSDLIWEVTRHQNAFLVKRKQAGGVQFSRDPLNLVNKHSRKYEGFANEKAIGINAGPNNTMVVTTKNASKVHQPAKAGHSQSFGAGVPARKAYRSIVSSTAKKGYRSDLRAEAVARASAVKKSQRSKGAKEFPAKLRGSRKNKAEAAKAE